jgi:hypothetical protein
MTRERKETKKKLSNISKTGNALGFTAAGETVTGRSLPGRKAWLIGGATAEGLAWPLSDPRRRCFPTAQEAEEYAQTLIDEAATNRLRWW